MMRHSINTKGGTTAYALAINGRWFYSLNKRGAILTAWSLAGAKLVVNKTELSAFKALAEARRKTAEIVPVVVGDTE